MMSAIDYEAWLRLEIKRIGITLLFIISVLITACQSAEKLPASASAAEYSQKTLEVSHTLGSTTASSNVVEETETPLAGSHFILSDNKVRQAIAYCTDKNELVRAVYPFLRYEEARLLTMDSFVPRNHIDYAGDENIKIYPFDPEKGKMLLEKSGWQLKAGAAVRERDQQSLTLKFATVDNPSTKAWVAVWVRQMAACGIQIKSEVVPDNLFFESSASQQDTGFDIAASTQAVQLDARDYLVRNNICNEYQLPEISWWMQNFAGWCNDNVVDSIRNANLAVQEEVRSYANQIIQQEFTKDIPSIPLFMSMDTFAISPDLEGFAPGYGEPYYTFNAQEWEIPGATEGERPKDTIIIGLAKEPSSLFISGSEIESAGLVASLLGYPRSFTSSNYQLTPYWAKDLSTVENGYARVIDVEVREGQKVYDSQGNVTSLTGGVKVIDTAGEQVVFAGRPIKMSQLMVTYAWRDDLKWQDGSPVGREDFELGYRVRCEGSGEKHSSACNKIQDVRFDVGSYTVSWLPGYHATLYFEAPWRCYPSHQPVVSEGPYKGKTLADVPLSEWESLKEVTETPWSYGPYTIKEWVKGQQMIFEANPYFFLGEPGTQRIIISFVDPQDAETWLSQGKGNILDPQTLPGVSQQLIEANKEGKIKLYLIPSTTWSQIDFRVPQDEFQYP